MHNELAWMIYLEETGSKALTIWYRNTRLNLGKSIRAQWLEANVHTPVPACWVFVHKFMQIPLGEKLYGFVTDVLRHLVADV